MREKVLVLKEKILEAAESLAELVVKSEDDLALGYDMEWRKQNFIDLEIPSDIDCKRLKKIFKVRLEVINYEIDDFEVESADAASYFLSQLYTDLIEDVEDCRKEKIIYNVV